MMKCDKHKRNLIPSQCKDCAAIVQIEKAERDIEEVGFTLQNLFGNYGDKVRSNKLDKIMEDGRAERERIKRGLK